MISGTFVTEKSDLDKIVQILSKVFHKDADHFSNLVYPELSFDKVYLLIYEEMDHKIPVATGIMTLKDESEAFIECISVLDKYQGREYGDFAVRMLLNRALINNYSKICLKTPKATLGFFEKVGFKAKESIEIENTTDSIDMIYGYDQLIKGCCNNCK